MHADKKSDTWKLKTYIIKYNDLVLYLRGIILTRGYV